jgi:glycosyltransferase involved in cell wall biosynthesis
MSSVHTRSDVRVFLKECRGLAGRGFAVTLVVADGLGTERREGVDIVDVGAAGGGRIGRALMTAGRVFAAARRLQADLYHFHDPELLPWALLLRLLGRRVVYDAHENVPHDIQSKPYLDRRLARPLAAVVGWFELFAAARLSAVVGATPDIVARFAGRARRTIGVFNFPLAEELARPTPWEARGPRACYIGLISDIRGARELAAAASLARTTFALAGRLQGGPQGPLTALPGWQRIDYRGVLDRNQVAELMASSRVGLVTFLPELNHINALPNKLFEYMSAGLPVVASDFPGWRAIVEESGCGLCVDPSDPAAIARAVDRLAGDDEFARACGERGAAAVRARFNWDSQLAALADGYRGILAGR